MDEIVFTPAAVLNLLMEIDELKDVSPLGISETPDGQIQVEVGESRYILSDENTVNIPVDPVAVDMVDEANADAYQGMYDTINGIESYDTIESGILGQLAKTLLIGGLVRLSSHALKRSMGAK